MPFFMMLAAGALQPPVVDNPPPPPGEWAWLNIPDAQGPGARFSYDTTVRRTGPLVELRLRYDEAANRAVEARIELDCAARTSRLLERRPPDPARPAAPAAAAVPSGLTTREGVLMHVLCPPVARAGQ